MDVRTAERIEILPVDLLDRNRVQVNGLKEIAASLGLEFGWHYLLDLTWILNRLEEQFGTVAGKRIIDAGAGTGVLQWYLAQQGAEVISIDRGSRASLPLRFRSRFHVEGLRKSDLQPARQVFRENFGGKRSFAVQLRSGARDLAGWMDLRRSPGSVKIYNQDLMDLVDIQDNSVDAVVAVSALEHNSPENLERVVQELLRVLKPGGVLAASLNAARDDDWWHTASSGWCYTDNSLKRLFCLPAGTPSNYDRYDELFSALQNCAELRDHLAHFYFRSGDNGMPWGKWDPQYIPVGVCKIK